MTINCGGELISLDTPKVMGILNCTPDSFYDGGKYKDEKAILLQVEKMLLDGATFVDVGAYSSKPNASEVSEQEEENRLLPIVKLLVTKFPKIILSVDTFRSQIAKKAIQNGAAIINDISAGSLDVNMMPTVGELQVPYIMMHLRGNPKTMQSLAKYDNCTKEVYFYFSEKIQQARFHKINDLIIDPGFGFAKTIDHNYELLENLELFQNLGLPVLAGISRKSMIYKALEITANDSLNGTTVLNTIALQKGAKILRVHDVKEAVECVKLLEMFSR